MRIHHLAFRTGDLARLEGFYVEALGLAVIRRNEARSVWLDAGGTLVMLEQRDEDEAPVAPSQELVAFAVAPDMRAIVEGRLAAAGSRRIPCRSPDHSIEKSAASAAWSLPAKPRSSSR